MGAGALVTLWSSSVHFICGCFRRLNKCLWRTEYTDWHRCVPTSAVIYYADNWFRDASAAEARNKVFNSEVNEMKGTINGVTLYLLSAENKLYMLCVWCLNCTYVKTTSGINAARLKNRSAAAGLLFREGLVLLCKLYSLFVWTRRQRPKQWNGPCVSYSCCPVLASVAMNCTQIKQSTAELLMLAKLWFG